MAALRPVGQLAYWGGLLGLTTCFFFMLWMRGGEKCMFYGVCDELTLTPVSWFVSCLHLVWFVAIFPFFIHLAVGFFLPTSVCFGRKTPRRIAGGMAGRIVSFRVVTKGENPSLVRETCARNIGKLLDRAPFPWIVEVVTDRFLDIRQSFRSFSEDHFEVAERVYEILVPDDYRTEKGTLYKARALNYANRDGMSTLGDDDIVVHLDEETLIDESSIDGIAQFINDNPNRIGIGLIVYGQDLIVNPWMTMADSFRITDDYTKHRLYFTLGAPLLGMKGSFVVMPVSIERGGGGWDLGPDGSITEDAVYVLKAIERKCKFGWVSGVMLEKSPFDLLDFLKQRRRWFHGLWLTALKRDLKLRTRTLLLIVLSFWSLLPVWAVLGLLNFFLYLPYPRTLFMMAIQCAYQGAFMWAYLWGAIFNFSPRRQGWLTYILYVAFTVALIPLWGLMEGCGILYAFLTRPGGFYVVKKELSSMEEIQKQTRLANLKKTKAAKVSDSHPHSHPHNQAASAFPSFTARHCRLDSFMSDNDRSNNGSGAPEPELELPELPVVSSRSEQSALSCFGGDDNDNATKHGSEEANGGEGEGEDRAEGGGWCVSA